MNSSSSNNIDKTIDKTEDLPSSSNNKDKVQAQGGKIHKKAYHSNNTVHMVLINKGLTQNNKEDARSTVLIISKRTTKVKEYSKFLKKDYPRSRAHTALISQVLNPRKECTWVVSIPTLTTRSKIS